MNELEKSSPDKEKQVTENGAMLDLDFFTKKPQEQPKLVTPERKPVTPNDDVMVDITPDASANPPSSVNNNISPQPGSPVDKILDLGLDNSKVETVENKETNSINERKDNIRKTSDVKSLADINVTLQSVQPSKVHPMTAFEEEGGLTVVLHFCKDKPRPDANVIVVSTTSKSSSPIEDYKFQAVVPKVSLEINLV